MGLPGRRTRNRLSKDERLVVCPVCENDTKITVQKRDNIKRVKSTENDNKVNILDENFDKTSDDSFTNERNGNCEECDNKLRILKSYSPR